MKLEFVGLLVACVFVMVGCSKSDDKKPAKKSEPPQVVQDMEIVRPDPAETKDDN